MDTIIYPGSLLSNMGAGLSVVSTGLFNSNAARPNATRVEKSHLMTCLLTTKLRYLSSE